MNKHLPRHLIVFCSLLGVLGIAVVDMGQTAPGKLARAHQGVEGLDGGENCAACHGSWFESMGDACLACHAVIEDHLDRNVGLHGRLADVEADRCSTCHSEHHGLELSLVNRQSFVHAGIPGREQFDHNMVDFDMTGKHLELECSKCHEFVDEKLIPEGEHRYLGLSSDCASCHEDPHEGAMRQSCGNCHSQDAFETRRYPRHAEFLPLEGSHAETDCLTCHDPDGERSLASQMAGTTPEQPRTCSTCHESPHRERFLLGNAIAAQLPKGQSCSTCHDAATHSFVAHGEELTPEEHAFSGFALDAPHGDVSCAACHEPAAKKFAVRFPGREQKDCAKCHESPHGTQFEQDPFSQNDCLVCHDQTAFAPHSFGAEQHAAAAIPLNGAHASLDCGSCHESFGPLAQRRFRGTPARCEDCHGDAHELYFEAELLKRGMPESGSCATCHSTKSFHEVDEERFVHGQWTPFRLQGAHAQNACESCHIPDAEPDHNGRRFGRVAEHFGVVEGCTTCHTDPHEGRFDGPDLPTEVDGRRDCLRCHSGVSFRSLPFGFDHGRWTGFALTGEHEATSCSSCHAAIPPSQRSAHGGRSWRPAKSSSCGDCHADPHAGQFSEAGRADCAKCHKASSSFSDLYFEHNLDSRFSLDSRHADLACAACHKSVTVKDRSVVRYRPLGITCADCHGMQAEVLRKSGRDG